MAVVHKLYYVRGHKDDEIYEKIGIFSSQDLAAQALERARNRPAFRGQHGRFMIDAGEFDFVWWGDGFGWSDDVDQSETGDTSGNSPAPRLVIQPLRQPPQQANSAVPVFTLSHTIVRSGDDVDHKEIGIFPAENTARQAMARVQKKPGFKDPRGCFTIEPWLLDVDY